MPTITGTPNDDVLVGTPDDDLIEGLGGNDTIYGGGAVTGDDLWGGEGDDTYIIQHPGDFVFELDDEGDDIVYTSFSYVVTGFVAYPGGSIEVLSTIQHSDTTPIDLGTTSAGTRLIIGNYGNNVLSGLVAGDYYGLLGDDIFEVTANSTARIIENQGEGNDTVRVSGSVGTFTLNAGASVETLTVGDVNSFTDYGLVGNELTQTIIGNRGDNLLDGGSGGLDMMIGGQGNDTYHMRHAGQQVVEAAGGGNNDRIIVYFDFALGSLVNIETLQAAAGTASINLLGNAQGNILRGNDGNNILNGGPGAADFMEGGGGDDTYRVNNAGDIVREAEGGGTDIIYVDFSYFLTHDGFESEFENLSSATHAGTANLNFSGNQLNNIIIGNYGANQLDGGLGGEDTLYGLAGNDAYTIRSFGDRAVEQAGQGTDSVYSLVSWVLEAGSEVEVVSTIEHAATTAIDLTGNEFAQTVVGNNGANMLDGKGGADLLAGLGGADTFRFTSALGAGNVDTLFDLSAADDTIALDDAIFAGLSPGALAAGAFVIGSAAQDADDRIIYNSATGQLLYDADGTGAGAAVHFATLQGAPAITAADFMVI
jgi:serralysin